MTNSLPFILKCHENKNVSMTDILTFFILAISAIFIGAVRQVSFHYLLQHYHWFAVRS